jgi:rhodanese-related sulfurtransferase
MVATITAQQLLDMKRKGDSIDLIDVRTPAEYSEVHVNFARSLPLDKLDPQAVHAERTSNGTTPPLYVICRSGSRSRQACEKLIAAGLTDVVSVEGGTQACEAAGVPVIRGKKTMSLDRQVRIVIGGMVVIGVAIAAFADPALKPIGLGLAGFMGAGLIFAGITDTCALAMLIAKLPWNQAGGSASAVTCTRSVLAVAALAVVASTAMAGHTKDTLDTVQERVQKGEAMLLDVREKGEWDQGHLASAKLLPLSLLEEGLSPEQLAKVLPDDKIIYCHCARGGRCLLAERILKPLGYDVRPLKSGFDDLKSFGFPATPPKAK